MKLLVSSVNLKEAVEAVAGGADIIDLKNPREGSLGANFPWVVRRVRRTVNANVEVSCAIGDVPNLPGTVALAALGAAVTGVDYIKVGLYGPKTTKEAAYLLRQVVHAARMDGRAVNVVAVGYADAECLGLLNPSLIPTIAKEASVNVAMLDTFMKDGTCIFDLLTLAQLQRFVDEAHSYGIKAAIAGSLRKTDLPTVQALGADIVGLRSAACTGSDRVDGHVTRELVHELASVVHEAESINGRRA
jgi:uncharacterized protein (UPF0264 family)